MRIAIITDAWAPQVNGVVTTLSRTAAELQAAGHRVLAVNPQPFPTVPLPTYPSIRLALRAGRRVARMLDTFAPHAVHIATEGPLGFAARRYCIESGLRFTTSFHTRFPQYVRMRVPVPESVTYALLRWFHAPAVRTMTPTESQRIELQTHGFRNVVIWSRGVDTVRFRPYEKEYLPDPRPISLYAGRVAVEKNLQAFLDLDLPGTKYVVGDGPDLDPLSRQYRDVRFVGMQHGETLVRHLAAADVFVFPSRTDTFGLVMLEAMACGVPVAAYPVTGPKDVIEDGVNGALDEDLGRAVRRALSLNGGAARHYAAAHSWAAATEQFLAHLAVNRPRVRTRRSARTEPITPSTEQPQA